MDMGFSFRVVKCSKCDVLMVPQLCGYFLKFFTVVQF